MSSPEKMITEQRENLFFLFVILAVAVIAYGPLMGGVWELSFGTTQALNAFVLLGVAFGDALLTVVKTGPFRPTINNHGLLLFGLSCLALAIASSTQIWPFSVLGLCLNVGALLSFCFGRNGVKAFYPALAGFGVVVMMLVLVPQVDELLRMLAGRVSAWALPLLGIRIDLLVQEAPFQVFLVAEKGAGVFNVATECNGVGILMSSVVLSLMLTLKRRVPAYGVALLLVASMLIGFGFNIIRIVAIALTALRTDLPYSVIHEGIGTIIYLLALLAIWLLNYLPVTRRRSA
ncbi:MAG: archaeosortase/exosortase family protein [bacterium]